MLRRILFGLIWMLMVGCGTSAAPTASPAAAPSPTPVRAPAPTPGVDVSGDPQLQNLIAEARADLVARTGVPAESMRVVRADAREWPDASIGCPQRGVLYIQVITPGYLLVLDVGGKQYEYHTDMQRVVLCEK
jgi:hypothetical protein